MDSVSHLFNFLTFKNRLGLFIENLQKEGGFNSYSDGTFSHNIEWMVYEAIGFINATTSAVSGP